MPPGLAGAGTVQQMSSQDSSSGSRGGTSMSMCAAAPLAASRCCRRRLADGGVDPCSEPSTCAGAGDGSVLVDGAFVLMVGILGFGKAASYEELCLETSQASRSGSGSK